MRVCDNCLSNDRVLSREVNTPGGGMGVASGRIELCGTCNGFLCRSEFHALVRRHQSPSIPIEAGSAKPPICALPYCPLPPVGNLAQYQVDRCESHQEDEFGVMASDCYCSTGGGDNMDMDVCHHHWNAS